MGCSLELLLSAGPRGRQPSVEGGGSTWWARDCCVRYRWYKGFARPCGKTLCSQHIADAHAVCVEPFLGLVKASSLRHALAAQGRGWVLEEDELRVTCRKTHSTESLVQAGSDAGCAAPARPL